MHGPINISYFVHWDVNFHTDHSKHTVLCRGDKREIFGHAVLIVPDLWLEILLTLSSPNTVMHLKKLFVVSGNELNCTGTQQCGSTLAILYEIDGSQFDYFMRNWRDRNNGGPSRLNSSITEMRNRKK